MKPVSELYSDSQTALVAGKENIPMKPRPLRDGIQLLGAVDWNRRLFDSLIPLPDGTS